MEWRPSAAPVKRRSCASLRKADAMRGLRGLPDLWRGERSACRSRCAFGVEVFALAAAKYVCSAQASSRNWNRAIEGVREQCYIALMSHHENKRARQLTFAQHLRRKGKKRGRKKSPDSGVSHLKRCEVSEDVPVHATLKVEEGLPDLRDFGVYEVLWNVFEAARERAGKKLDG